VSKAKKIDWETAQENSAQAVAEVIAAEEDRYPLCHARGLLSRYGILAGRPACVRWSMLVNSLTTNEERAAFDRYCNQFTLDLDRMLPAEVEKFLATLTPGDSMATATATKSKKRAGKTPKTPPVAQKTFEGEGFPDKPPAAVIRARDEYLQAMRDHADAGKEKSTRHEALVEVMHKHGITRIRLDGENKFFELESTENVKMKTVPKAARDGDEDFLDD
jgi:hypothetical protein